MARSLSTAEILHYVDHGLAVPSGTVTEPFVLEGEFDKQITLTRITFLKNVRIRGFTSAKAIQFVNCSFESEFHLSNSCNLVEVRLLSCKFESSCSISFSKIVNLAFTGNYCRLGLISENLECSSLSLELVTSNSSKFIFHGPQINTCIISKFRDDSELIFTSYDKKNTPQNNSYVETISFTSDSQFTGNFILINLVIHNLSLAGFNKSGRLIFQELTVRLISCSQFTNTGIISVSKISVDTYSILQLHQSNIGKCELYDVDFTAFKAIRIANSGIQDIVPTNVTWCEKVESDLTDKSNFSHLREIYRQLKNVMAKNQDKIQELKYHKLEMNFYLEQISVEKGNWPDQIIVWTNKISNSHGLSWTRALSLLLGTSFIFYTSNKWLLGYNHYNSDLFWKDCASYFESINPVRKFSTIYNTYTSGWKPNLAIFLDVIFRIISSYLIFQFISAFRKYVKK